MTGTHLSLVTRERTSGPAVAKAACGINANKEVREVARLGEVQTMAGKADRVRVVDAQNVRTYDVTSDGILVGSTYADATPDEPLRLVLKAAGVLRSVPSDDIFTEESLERSAVPPEYRHRPSNF